MEGLGCNTVRIEHILYFEAGILRTSVIYEQ